MKLNTLLLSLGLGAMVLLLCCQADDFQKDTIQTVNILDFTGRPFLGYLSASEFKEAIVGKWHSVWQHPSASNVKYLQLTSDGKAAIHIEGRGKVEKIKGTYSVDFLRPPHESAVTFGKLTVTTTSGEQIVLSRVYFGDHNAVSPRQSWPFLRIDREPYGVLEKEAN